LPGVELVATALNDEAESVIKAAYVLLKIRLEPKIKQVLEQVNTWKFAECLCTIEGHSDSVLSVAISPDGKTLVSGSSDKTIKVWDLEMLILLFSLEGHKVWYLETGILLFSLEGHSGSVNTVAIRPDGTMIVSGSSDKTIKVWYLMTGDLQYTLEGHSDSVNTVAISPDGKTIVSGSSDKTIKVWGI
jgi:WD40 repeat protein